MRESLPACHCDHRDAFVYFIFPIAALIELAASS
jgi:hypothetical protein